MKTIAQRDLRNHSSEILRQAEAGNHFSITVDGRPVAILGPLPRRQWVAKSELLDLLSGSGADPGFRDDVAFLGGSLSDQEPAHVRGV